MAYYIRPQEEQEMVIDVCSTSHSGTTATIDHCSPNASIHDNIGQQDHISYGYTQAHTVAGPSIASPSSSPTEQYNSSTPLSPSMMPHYGTQYTRSPSPLTHTRGREIWSPSPSMSMECTLPLTMGSNPFTYGSTSVSLGGPAGNAATQVSPRQVYAYEPLGTPVDASGDMYYPSICWECVKPGSLPKNGCKQYSSGNAWLVHFWSKHYGVVWSPQRCVWKSSCNPDNVYETSKDWVIHAWDEHQELIWTPQLCFWEDCRSKVTYRTSKDWLKHVAMVHRKTVCCEVPNCRYARGNPEGNTFRSNSERNKHMQQVHDDPIFCEKPYCAHKTSRLNRKDHAEKHQRKFHGPFYCTVEGCYRSRIDGVSYGFENERLLEVHTREDSHRHLRNFL